MLPSGSLPMPAEWRGLLEELAPVFARRSTHRLFMALACGLILADRGTVTAMAAAAVQCSGAGMLVLRHREWVPTRWGWRWPGCSCVPAQRGGPVLVAVAGLLPQVGPARGGARWATRFRAGRGSRSAPGCRGPGRGLPCCPSPVALPVLFRLWRGGPPSQVQLAAGLLAPGGRSRPAGARHRGAAFHGGPWSSGATWPPGCRPARSSPAGRRPPGGAAGPGQGPVGTCRTPPPSRLAGRAVRIYGGQRVLAAAWPCLWYGSFRMPRPARPTPCVRLFSSGEQHRID